MTWAAILGFVVAVVPIVVTPGASFALATQRTLAGDRHATGWVVAGTATGIYCHALFAAAGLSAVVMRSSQVFTAVRLVGGLYLVGLGALALWRTRNRGPRLGRPPQAAPPGRHTYPQAVLANVLNPKAAAVYLTLAPQFLTARHLGLAPMTVLATAHVCLMAAWLSTWSVVLAHGRTAATSPRFATIVNRIGGAVLIALGVRSAVTN